jgi:hypothetical protein
MGRKQWRCFHCDDVFTREQDAAEHFGGTMGALAACQIKGHEHFLVREIRELERQVAMWVDERVPVLLALEAMRTEHADALRREEEIGYARGLRDAMRDGLAA